MKAIIIGAGIAGPAMAMQLMKNGIRSEIFEARNSDEMNEGVFLGITPNGLNVLRELIDIQKLMKDYTAGKMSFYNSKNKLIGELDTAYQSVLYGSETIQVKRADLNKEIRLQAEKCQIRINYNKKLRNITESSDKVLAEFSDGTIETGDILLACDGTHSACRELIFPGIYKPEYTGQLSTGAFVKMNGMEKKFGDIKMIFGKNAFFAYAVSNVGEVWWFNNFSRDAEPSKEEIQSTLQSEIKNYLVKIHKEDPHPIQKIIENTQKIFVYPVYDISSVKTWHTGRVCLIGDAAHATAPHIGQGASLALEDTVVLANCIMKSYSPESAFKDFQKKRQPRVEKLIRTARKVGNKKSEFNPVAAFFRNLLLKHFIKSEARKLDWVYSYNPWVV